MFELLSAGARWAAAERRHQAGTVEARIHADLRRLIEVRRDSPALHAALLEEIEVPDEIALLPEDAAFLAAHYLQYWGMIFVVGQRLSVAEPGETVGFDIVVAGDYRLEAEGPVRFDGVRLQPGESVRFETGPHEFTAGPGMTETVLRWADLGEAPDAEPVGLLEFFGVEP